MTFWEHLDELRGCLVRIFIAVFVAAIVAFCFKDLLFAFILAPKESDFVTYHLFDLIAGKKTDFRVDLINVDLAQQFLVHMRVALWVGLLLVSPYVLYVLFGFISPALYRTEKRFAVRAVGWGYVMFLIGMALNYFVIFPFTFRFLGTYQVSSDISNMISLTSYISMLLSMCLILGILFELPILCWLLAKIGILTSAPMRKYRRHAIVAILILSAIITPTGDAVTLSIVALPIYLLYELSILVVKHNERPQVTV